MTCLLKGRGQLGIDSKAEMSRNVGRVGTISCRPFSTMIQEPRGGKALGKSKQVWGFMKDIMRLHEILKLRIAYILLKATVLWVVVLS